MLNVIGVISSVGKDEGGAAEVALSLGEELRRAGCPHLLITTDADGRRRQRTVQYRKPIAVAGNEVIFRRSHWPRRFKASIGLASSVWTRSRTASHIHIHGHYLWCTVVGAVAARRRGIPYFIQVHGGLEPYHQRKSKLVKHAFDALLGRSLLSGATKIICASESECENVNRLGYSNTIVIRHGVSAAKGNASQEILSVLDRLNDRQIVLFLGRFAKKKHPDLLIQAWCAQERRDGTLVIVGPDDDWAASELRSIADEAGSSNSVVILPPAYEADKWELLRRADLFALPSDNENFGVAVAEAMYAGTACIVSDAVAMSADVRACGGGWVVPELDVPTWDQALSVALTDRDELDRRSSKANAFGVDRYDWTKIALDYIDLYNSTSEFGR